MPYVVVSKGSRQLLSSTSVFVYAEIVVKVGVTLIVFCCILICRILNGIVAIKFDFRSDVPTVVGFIVFITSSPISNALSTAVPTAVVMTLRRDVESTWLILTLIESDFPKASVVVFSVCYTYNSVIFTILAT